MATETITVKKEQTTLSALLARHYRKVFPNMAGGAYDLNQNLAEGVYLPVGRDVTVKTLATMEAENRVGTPVVDLFS